MIKNAIAGLSPGITHSFSFLSFLNKRLIHLSSTNNMKFAQFQRGGEDKICVGVLSEDGKSVSDLSDVVKGDLIQLIKSNPSLADIQSKAKAAKQEPVGGNVRLLSPITNPEKIVCIGLNYLGHCQEQNKEAPKEPMFFSKYASTITGPTGDVILHQITNVNIGKQKFRCHMTEILLSVRCSNWIGKLNWPL